VTATSIDRTSSHSTSSQGRAPSGIGIKRPPQRTVETPARSTPSPPRRAPRAACRPHRCVRDVGAQSVRRNLGIAPRRHFLRHDRGRSTSRPRRSALRSRNTAECPAESHAATKASRRTRKFAASSRRSPWKRRRAGGDVEQDVPLRAEHHHRREPDIRVQTRTGTITTTKGG